MSMRFGLALLWFLATGSVALAQALKQEEFDPYKGPTPIVVHIMSSPWMDTDVPGFILYEDRTVIFAKDWRSGDYRTARLEQPVFDKVITRVRTLCAGARWHSKYSMSSADDDSSSHVFVQLEDVTVATEVYGFHPAALAESPLSPPFPSGTLQEKRTPAALVELITYLMNFEAAGARKWNPGYIEVVLSPHEAARYVTASWPAKWPSLKSEHARQGIVGRHGVYLPGDQLGAVKKLVESSGEQSTVVLAEGRKWVLWYRYVFPGQPVWMRALRRVPL